MLEGIQRTAAGTKLSDLADLAGEYRRTGMFDDLAKLSTKNPESPVVVLGKFMQDGVSYLEVAKQSKSSYFLADNWDRLAGSMTRDEMWKINEAFLRQQVASGKQFTLSHNPYTASGAFKKEVSFLMKAGYTFTQDGSVWRATR